MMSRYEPAITVDALEAFGASHTIDPTRSEGPRTLAAVREMLGSDDIDVILEASGSARAVSMGLSALAIGGVAVLIGSVSPGGKVTLDPERIVRGLITVTGVHNYTPADLRGAVNYLRTRGEAWPFASVVGATMPLSRIDAAIERASTGDLLRVGVTPYEPQEPAGRVSNHDHADG